MAINKAFFLTAVADDLNDFGEWSTAEGGYLERQLMKALHDVWDAFQWAFRITSVEIQTTTGTQGPYPVDGMPADFDQLVTEEKVNKTYAYDAYGVPPPIPDASFGQRYPIVFDRVTSKINFLVDPGTGTKTLYYLRLLPEDIDDVLALLPNSESLKKILTARTAHYALINTPAFAAPSKTYWDQSELLLTREKLKQRKGSSRPDTRTPLNTAGNPAYYGLQGDIR